MENIVSLVYFILKAIEIPRHFQLHFEQLLLLRSGTFRNVPSPWCLYKLWTPELGQTNFLRCLHIFWISEHLRISDPDCVLPGLAAGALAVQQPAFQRQHSVPVLHEQLQPV